MDASRTMVMMTDNGWRCRINFDGQQHDCRVLAIDWDVPEDAAPEDEFMSPVIVYPNGMVDPVAGSYRMWHIEDGSPSW